MNTFINEMIKRKKEQERVDNKHNKLRFKKLNKQQLETMEYNINTIYLGKVANRPAINGLADDALLIFVENSGFMDIETGKVYKYKNPADVHPSSKEVYVTSKSPVYYVCYETFKDMGIEAGTCLTVKQLREVYDEHSKRWGNAR